MGSARGCDPPWRRGWRSLPAMQAGCGIARVQHGGWDANFQAILARALQSAGAAA